MGEKKWAFDYKKEYKELYMPKSEPGVVKVPLMNYIAVRGRGDSKAECSRFRESVGLLYGIAYRIKMSKKYGHLMAGYFDYVIPPPEGLWCQENTEESCFISMIRLPYFVTEEDLDWARKTAARKRRSNFSEVEFFTYNEGLCVQCMHIGPCENKPETIRRMQEFMRVQGYEPDTAGTRFHHEIYLSDPGRTAAEKQKTVIRYPVI